MAETFSRVAPDSRAFSLIIMSERIIAVAIRLAGPALLGKLDDAYIVALRRVHLT